MDNTECINIIRYIRDINSNSGISRERLLFANWSLFGITNVRKIVIVVEYVGTRRVWKYNWYESVIVDVHSPDSISIHFWRILCPLDFRKKKIAFKKLF